MTKTAQKPDMSDAGKVMQQLRDEHAYMGALRKAMAEEVTQLKHSKQPDLVILRDMMRYLMEYPDIHHHPLEDRVFDQLLKHTDSPRSAIIELLAEHKDLARESQFLYHKLDALVSGQEKLQKQLLRSNITDFLEQYNAHVGLEETTVFPAAEALLTDKEWQDIARDLPAINDPVFGEGTAERYHRLRRRLADGLDTASSLATMTEFLGIYSLWSALGAVAEGTDQLASFNRQQLNDFKETNIAAFRQSGSLPASLSRAFKNNRRLIKKGIRQRLRIVRDTTRAAALPFSESRDLITSTIKHKTLE